jgi:hypothetical protein
MPLTRSGLAKWSLFLAAPDESHGASIRYAQRRRSALLTAKKIAPWSIPEGETVGGRRVVDRKKPLDAYRSGGKWGAYASKCVLARWDYPGLEWFIERVR